MSKLQGLLKRVAALETTQVSNVVRFTMPDGSFRKMKSKRVIEACTEALYGSQSDEVETLLTSVGNNANHKLIDLLKMCLD